jgi:hypothetical protein
VSSVAAAARPLARARGLGAHPVRYAEPDIPKQNKASTDPAGATAAINDMVSLRQTFDTAVAAITFPDADKSDAQAVLSADASLESALGTLAANTDNIPNYNSIFPTTLSAQSAFTAADAALSRDLGL